MTPPISVIFCGSFQEYSVQVLAALAQDPNIKITAVITTPPHPQGRNKVLQPNPVHHWAEEHSLTVLTPDSLSDQLLAQLLAAGQPDYLITAGYGKLLPAKWLQLPKKAALNVHFSLLPKFRGANPAEWAILMEESETGVSIIEMSPEFDTGSIVAQASNPLSPTATRKTVYQDLYRLGGEMIVPTLSAYEAWKNKQISTDQENLLITQERTLRTTQIPLRFFFPPQQQPASPTPMAKRLQKEDGFIAWKNVISLMKGQDVALSSLSPTLQTAFQKYSMLTPQLVAIMTRALAEFPGVWTLIPSSKGEKRMKILSVKIIQDKLVLAIVHIEGQQISPWNQVKNQVEV